MLFVTTVRHNFTRDAILVPVAVDVVDPFEEEDIDMDALLPLPLPLPLRRLLLLLLLGSTRCTYPP
jgi:hypothetical protein